MKRTIVILALVTAFVLAFTAVAQATWRGFTPVRTVLELGTGTATLTSDPQGPTPWVVTDMAGPTGATPVSPGGMNGFITFPEARNEMLRNLGRDEFQMVDGNGDPTGLTPNATQLRFYYRVGSFYNPLGTYDAGDNQWSLATDDVTGDFLGVGDPAWANYTMAMVNVVGGNFRTGGAYAAFGHNVEAAAQLQGTVHGGYVTTTTKCVVCHSVHRATGLEDPARVGSLNNPGTNVQRNQNQAFLTAGASSCIECHVIWGSQPSRLLVEWGGPWGSYTAGGGPHGGPRRGCTMCHNAGIHGLTTSQFNVMNVFMLGNTRRAGEAWCENHQNLSPLPCPDCGVVGGNPGAGPPNPANMNRDEQILAEMHLWTGPDSRGYIPIQIPGEPGADPLNTWWWTGARSLGPVGGTPPAMDAIGTIGTTVGAAYGAARSMATAYTCGEAGCHTTGAFFLTNWGVGKERADSIRRQTGVMEPDGAVPTAAQNNAMRRIGDVDVTGHVTPSARATSGPNQACGPCHAGNPAGFPRASTNVGARDTSRRAYGCDQCHDMVGIATNSTAWPHGNRNIVVYEWTADGVQLDAARTLNATGQVVAGPNIARTGNLWMYAGSIARSYDATMQDRPTGAAGAPLQSFLGSGDPVTGIDAPNFADQSWFVMTNVASGRYGVPSNAADTLVTNTGTGLVDGSCLKCHVAMDSASMSAAGSQAADALAHAWGRGNAAGVPSATGAAWAGTGTPRAPEWTGVTPLGSSRLFLYR